MLEHRTRRAFLAGSATVAALGLAGCTGIRGTGGKSTETTGNSPKSTENGTSDSVSGQMTIFHAGSLEPPMSMAEKSIEQKYNIDVDREAKGSVGSTKKVTEQSRSADVLGVSDFRLIRDLMMPKFANWYSLFATNAMTVVYTDESKYAAEFSPNTWWDILSRDDVKVAHSDPAVDPNGYRSVMSMQLGAKKLDGNRLYNQPTAKTLQQNTDVGASTETELIAQVKAGALDYAWEYQSTGATHDVQTVDLQPHVDLSKATQKYANHYAKVSVSAGGNTFTGAPIAYGITVPSVAKNPQAGAAWVEYFVTKPGRQMLEKAGFVPIEPVVVPTATGSAVPKSIKTHAKVQPSLGPLQLNPKESESSTNSLAPIHPMLAAAYR